MDTMSSLLTNLLVLLYNVLLSMFPYNISTIIVFMCRFGAHSPMASSCMNYMHNHRVFQQSGEPQIIGESSCANGDAYEINVFS